MTDARSEIETRVTSTSRAIAITTYTYQRGVNAEWPSTRLETAAADEDRSLAERGQVLGAAVTIRMLDVRGAYPEPNREKRQRCGDDVAD